MDKLEIGAGLFVIAIIVFMIWACVAESRRPGFELKKADWVCTQSHQETRQYFIYVGDVMVPQIATDDVCDQWIRK